MQPCNWALFLDNWFPGRDTQALCSLLNTAASVCFLIGYFLAVIFT